MSDLLRQPAFCALPLTAIEPAGWLKRQLRIQADGLSGHLCDFWPDISDSQWFGGRADGWERAPYWLDGAIPLAFLTGDAKLKAKVHAYVDYIVRHQQEDGWVGPGGASHMDRKGTDVWGLLLAGKALAQYGQAAGHAGVLASLHRCLKAISRHTQDAPLFKWGQFRGMETLLPLYWVYEQTGDQMLLDLVRSLRCQAFDWSTFYLDLPEALRRRATAWTFDSHVVNTAMMLKYPALLWRFTGRDEDRRMPGLMLDALDRYHGQATGLFTGDECLAGLDPTAGTELCAVVELMYSLENLVAILGESRFADRLELVAFNALPATFSADMWTHQYDHQANQVSCTIRSQPVPWTTNGPESNLFGLEPNFGCCTANLSQGWPKYAAHLWMALPQGGLAAISYAPCRVKHRIGQSTVQVGVETEYPFRSDVHISVHVDQPVSFPVLLRIPAWAQEASVRVGGVEVSPEAGGFCRIERQWQGTTEIQLVLPMRAVGQRRFNNSLSISRGPLVYCLKIGQQWTRYDSDRPNRQPPHCDYQVAATTPWNYALDANEATLQQDLVFTESPVGECPFAAESAPVYASAQARRLPQWPDGRPDAVDLPVSPVASPAPLEQVTLIPYGCARLRLTEMPTLK